MNNRDHRAVKLIAAHVAARGVSGPIDVGSIAACDTALLDAYLSGVRVRVNDGRGWIRTGTVSATRGRAPMLLLMHRSNARGSWDVLGADDRVVGVWDGRRYQPVVAVWPSGTVSA